MSSCPDIDEQMSQKSDEQMSDEQVYYNPRVYPGLLVWSGLLVWFRSAGLVWSGLVIAYLNSQSYLRDGTRRTADGYISDRYSA